MNRLELTAKSAWAERERPLLAAVSLAAALALAVGVSGSLSAPTTVTATLSAAGTIEAPQQLALGFSGQGRLIEVDVHAGQEVGRGQLLARLDPSGAAAALASAEANLAAARAQLRQLKQGLSPAERTQLRVAMHQARQAVAAAGRSLGDARDAAAQDATRLETAFGQATAQLAVDQTKLGNDQAKYTSDQATLTDDQGAVSAAGSQLAADRSHLAGDQARLLADQKKQADDQAQSPQDPAKLAADAKTILDDEAAVGADQAKLATDGSAPGDARSAVAADQARLEADQQALTADEDRIAADDNAISNAENAQVAGTISERQSVHDAASALSVARLNAAATAAGNSVHAQSPRLGALTSARAAVAGSAAAVGVAEQALRETRLVAPFAGTIGSVDAVVGQLVASQGAGVITLVDLGHLTVAATFSVAEAALLAAGQPATITVPALGEELRGHVAAVDPVPVAAAPNPPSDASAAAASPHPVGTAGSGDEAMIVLDGAPATLRPGLSVQVVVRASLALARHPPSVARR